MRPQFCPTAAGCLPSSVPNPEVWSVLGQRSPASLARTVGAAVSPRAPPSDVTLATLSGHGAPAFRGLPPPPGPVLVCPARCLLLGLVGSLRGGPSPPGAYPEVSSVTSPIRSDSATSLNLGSAAKRGMSSSVFGGHRNEGVGQPAVQ